MSQDVELKPGEAYCARCLLGHGPSPWDTDRPDGHEKLACVVFHGASLCVECYRTIVWLARADW